jgi:hypothetical protein
MVKVIKLSSNAKYSGVERRKPKINPMFAGLAGLGILAIAYATLCPIGLRPHLASANTERFGAYFVLGFIAALAAPRRISVISVLIVLLAFGLEAAQLIIPSRDAALNDAIVKGFGGMVGAQCGVMTFSARRWLMRVAQPPRPVVTTTRV